MAIHALAGEPGPPMRITPPVSAPAPASSLAQARESFVFKEAACRGMADGLYCGTGDNRELRFQCTGGQIAFQQSCPGGCDERSLQCRPKTGLKAID